MLLTISTTHYPATNLGFLLHKHPDKFQSVDLGIGNAHIFYPESSEAKTTIALLLDIDPIDMVKSGRSMGGKGFSLGQYVNDRPYVASSFMSVAIAKAFSTAMNGKCANKPELVNIKMPFEAKISVLPAPKGGEVLIRKLFEPLGYQVKVQRHILDKHFKNWGESKYYTVELSNTIRIKELLSHLYVLIPALDTNKHYFISENEIDKLLEKGRGWLPTHPEMEQISRRYLINLKSFYSQAIKRLNDENEVEEELNTEEIERIETLHQKRLNLVVEQLNKSKAKSVIDLGCGDGKLLRLLIKEKHFSEIVGMDVSHAELKKAKTRMHWDEMAPRQKDRITLFQGALTYIDKRIEGFEAAAIVEVIEHLDENRLHTFERVVFEYAKPKTVVLTTPNADYNVMFKNMELESLRHADHRFEWTRKQFENWANKIAKKNNYFVKFLPVGDVVENIGAPSQMGVFTYGN